MRTVLFLIVFTATGANCATRPDDAKTIAYAKHIHARVLDQSLPSIPLDRWLVKGAPAIERSEWRVDCEKAPEPSDSNRPLPICVEVRFWRRGAWGIVMLRVGEDGILGKPRVEYVFVRSRGESTQDSMKESPRLSDLPRLISEIEQTNTKVEKH